MCRTANGADANALPNQNPQLKDGRGNICPCTIILPKLAMMATNHWTKNIGLNDPNIVEYFMQLLDDTIYDAKDDLIERFEWIASQSPESAKFMYENNTMYGYEPDKGIISALMHGTLAIGQIGLAETLQILVGCDHTEPAGMKLAKRIEQLFKDRCAEFKKEFYHFELPNAYGELVKTDCHLNFGVYFTPAENLCYTSMKKFQAEYGIIPNVSDKDFFTNSIHVPVWKEISPIEKINIESELTGYSSAGCITYVELDGAVSNNLTALETLVNYAMDKDIPYFALNIPLDYCMDCGFTGEFNDKCTCCGGQSIQRLRRVTGYLTGDYKTAFNLGKQQEVEKRYKHSNKIPNWKH